MRLLIAIATLVMAAAAPCAAQPISVAEYVQRGGPALDHVWTAQDFGAARETLSALPQEQLPRLSDPASAPILARFSDATALLPCDDRSVALAARLQTCMALGEGAAGVMNLYIVACGQDQTLADECMRVIGFMLHTITVMSALAEEFAPSLDPNDPSYATRMAGLARMRSGLVQTLDGSTQMIRSQGAFSEPERERFASILALVAPRLRRSLPEEDAARFFAAMRELAQSDANPAVRSALQSFLE